MSLTEDPSLFDSHSVKNIKNVVARLKLSLDVVCLSAVEGVWEREFQYCCG